MMLRCLTKTGNESRLENATTQLLIHLAFLLPKGTDVGPKTDLGKALIAFRDAAIEIGRRTVNDS